MISQMASASCVSGVMSCLCAQAMQVDSVVRIDEDLAVRHHYHNPVMGVTASIGVEEGVSQVGEWVYRNAPPLTFMVRSGSSLVADDVLTVSVEEFALSGYETIVGGCDGDGTGPAFTANFAFWDHCPADGGQIIAGTEATVILPDDGLHEVTIDLSDSPVTVPPSFWFSVQFDDPNGGIVFDGPAAMGFTADLMHTPTIPCEHNFESVALYSGFHLAVFGEGTLRRQFPAFLNTGPVIAPFHPGVDQWLLHQVEIAHGTCILSSFQVSAVADGGPYSLETALFTHCSPLTPIEGTNAIFQGEGDGNIETFEFVVSPGLVGSITVPEALWIGWRFDTIRASVLLVDDAEIGRASDNFALPPDFCSFINEGDLFIGFQSAVFCAGESATGGCCDLRSLWLGSEHQLCQDRSIVNCLPDQFRTWTEGAQCDVAFSCCDGYLNLGRPIIVTDWHSMRLCVSGPIVNVDGPCQCADLTTDGDVDLEDMGVFMNRVTAG